MTSNGITTGTKSAHKRIMTGISFRSASSTIEGSRLALCLRHRGKIGPAGRNLTTGAPGSRTIGRLKTRTPLTTPGNTQRSGNPEGEA